MPKFSHLSLHPLTPAFKQEMRKHGWQLPHHPLQVVAVSVFLALGFAFYVFFAPFVRKKLFQYIVIGLYSPLITCVFSLYIWCAAVDPADPGVFKSRKYHKFVENKKHIQHEKSMQGGMSTSSKDNINAATFQDEPVDLGSDATGKYPICESEKKNAPSLPALGCTVLLGLCPHTSMCSHMHERSSEQQISEDGMFYCTLCEVEVFKYSKHCRVCDKCVDGFDHHCRWLNNCIGKKNYIQFFILMVSALFLLILQWLIGIFVIICCFLERRQFSVEVTSQLGSSFSFVAFVIVVASCTILAMTATLPLCQLLCFHILLTAKGISTYDYIIALREQEQQGVGGQQNPKMSPASSLTGLSSASSGSTFQHGQWCTPPRLFFEDQFNVVPPEAGGSIKSPVKRTAAEEGINKKNHGTVKISPWMLAHLNAEEVSKVAAQARKKSRILQPVARRQVPLELETGSSNGQMISRTENQRRTSKRIRLPLDIPPEPRAKIPDSPIHSNANDLTGKTSSGLAPLQSKGRSAFLMTQAMSASAGFVAYSPESSQDSPDLHPFRFSSSGAEEGRGLTALHEAGLATHKGILLSRSTSDGYEPSGGEDSDQIPSRSVHRPTNWSNILFASGHDNRFVESKALPFLK